jgi:hypothetical protein
MTLLCVAEFLQKSFSTFNLQSMKELKKKTQVDNLVQAILDIPGSKILTLALSMDSVYTFDVNERGAIGYHKSHRRLFYAKLRKAMNTYGGLIIRQFLPIKVESVLPNGKKMWIPIKNVYGVSLGQGSWNPLSAAEVSDACCTDAETGKPIPPESTVRYVAFPVVKQRI